MNYIGLVALILGLISIFITIKYVDSYDKLTDKLGKIGSSSMNFKYPQELLDIQDELNLTDSEFKQIISENRDKIINILKKEGFVNFNTYLNAYQRRIPRKELSNLFKEAKKKNYIAFNPDKHEKTKSFTYKKEIEYANKAIDRQDIKNVYSLNKTNDSPSVISKNTDNTKPICINQYGGNIFTRYINEDYECDGKLTRNLVCKY